MVRSTSPFADALSILHSNYVSGIALVNEHGILVGNFSASDLVGIKPYVFANLSWTVEDFLAKGTQVCHYVACITLLLEKFLML
jgi:CBS domain-containing protein